MPYIRTYSDIHEDLAQKLLKKKSSVDKLWMPPELPTDKETVLVLAGDLWIGRRSVTFQGKPSMLPQLAKKFLAVVVVLGNHDIWGEYYPDFPKKFEEELSKYGLDNVFLLDALGSRVSQVIDGINFVGTTMWTNMNKNNPNAVLEFNTALGMNGKSLWNDKNFIRVKDRGAFKHLTADHLLSIHKKSYVAIKGELEKSVEPVVLVTHHAPLEKSLGPDYLGRTDSAYYASDLQDLLFNTQAKILAAIHGHIHLSQSYEINDIKFICNPVGYPGERSEGFKDNGFLMKFEDGKLKVL